MQELSNYLNSIRDNVYNIHNLISPTPKADPTKDRVPKADPYCNTQFLAYFSENFAIGEVAIQTFKTTDVQLVIGYNSKTRGYKVIKRGAIFHDYEYVDPTTFQTTNRSVMECSVTIIHKGEINTQVYMLPW